MVTIGTQTWMAENLNYAAKGSWCIDSSASNCEVYGRLYDWETVMNGSGWSASIPSGVKGICPDGWHVPSDGEWETLMTTVGGADNAGTKLKSRSGWDDDGNGTDEFGFRALPGGYRDDYAPLGGVGRYCNWWSATEASAFYAWSRHTHYRDAYVLNDDRSKSYGYSLRCLRD